MELPDPLKVLFEAVENLLAPALCLFQKCIYAPLVVISRQRLKSGMVITRYSYTCCRCGKVATVPAGRHARWKRKANVSWEHYRE